MRLFSKITFLFNICFLVAVGLWYYETHRTFEGKSVQAMPLPWLEGSFVVLGYTAILVNTLFLLLTFIFYAFRSNIQIPRWIIIFNIILFCCEVYFHFFLK